MIKIAATLFTITLLSACASQDKINKGELADIPDWILMPQIEDGIAQSACVPWSGQMAIDKDEASHIARDRLAKQIDLRAAGMTKAYASKTTTNADMNTGSNFESVSRQIFDQKLIGSTISKAGLFSIDKRQQFCVMIEINPEQTKDLYQGIIAASGVKLSPTDDRILLEQFKANKAQQALDKTVSP